MCDKYSEKYKKIHCDGWKGGLNTRTSPHPQKHSYGPSALTRPNSVGACYHSVPSIFFFFFPITNTYAKKNILSVRTHLPTTNVERSLIIFTLLSNERYRYCRKIRKDIIALI